MTKSEILKIAKPILFNSEMVKAILDDRKSCTRRVVKFPEGMTGRLPDNGLCGEAPYLFYPGGIKKPKYQVGNYLYIRETHQYEGQTTRYDNDSKIIYQETYYAYKADGWGHQGKWTPSIHMPKEAARIFLQVTGVRVERLQDITSKQAALEGVGDLFYSKIACGEKDYGTQIDDEYGISKEQYAWLWDSTIPKKLLEKYGWNANPWVFVYEFERVKTDE